MIKLLILLAVTTTLAFYSQQVERKCRIEGTAYQLWADGPYVLLVAILILFAGLRCSYNDTESYMRSFRLAPELGEYLGRDDIWSLTDNPAFYLFQSALRTITSEAQVLVLLTSAFCQFSIVLFFKRYSADFALSIFLYQTLGTFAVSMAAMKQAVATGILLLAFPALEKRQWVKFYLMVFLASMFHTFAFVYAVLPLFAHRPWKPVTYLFLLGVIFVMMNFEEVLTAFMEQGGELGKEVHASEVFYEHGVNIFRILVYMVIPILSFMFRRWIFRDRDRIFHVLVHMSIISMAFMLLGKDQGANIFARMAHYFELGTICCLPRMLKETFETQSRRLVTLMAAVCFVGFYYYDFAIAGDFDAQYKVANLADLFWRMVMNGA